MSYCDTIISHAIRLDCQKPPVKGLEHDGILINRDDIDFATSVVSGNKITTLALKTSKKGVSVSQYGKTPFNGSSTELNVGTNISTWNHKVSIFVPTHGSKTSSSIIDPFSNGEFVVILKNKAKADFVDSGVTTIGDGYDNKYEVFGWYQGLKASSITRDPYSDETYGGYVVELTEEGAPLSGLFLVNSTSEAATDTAYNSLL